MPELNEFKTLTRSLSTLSLQGPEAITAMVGVGLVGVGTLAALIFKEWKSYEAKKHLEKINVVNKLHDECLSRIRILDQTKTEGLPQIFQFSANSKTVSSLHYNDSEVSDIGVMLPQVPVKLTCYRQHVLDALLKLKEYYFTLNKKDKHDDDVTKGVLSYLMNILQNNCLCFEGYGVDIAYLKAINDFIIKYASQDNREVSQHFSHLRNVYTSLEYATQELEKHKESMSLPGVVDQARNDCLDESNRLIRLLVKMVIPEKFQKLAETVTCTELMNDIIRKKYIEKEIKGIPLSTSDKVELPKSIFATWIRGVAKYYMLSLNPHTLINEKELFLPQEIYAFYEIAKSEPEGTKLKDKYPEKWEQILQVFKHSPNFINTKLDEKDNFVPFDKQEDILSAIEFMADFTHLIHGVISMQTLSAKISSNMTQLGLDFFDNQDNFNRLLSEFNSLYSIVEKDLIKLQKKMKAISIANKNVPRLGTKLQFQNDVDRALENIQSILLPAADKVRTYKNKHSKTIDDSIKKINFFNGFFEKMYENSIQQPISKKPEVIQSKKDQSNKPESKQSSELIAQQEASLNQLSHDLSTKISEIQQQKDPHTKIYQKMCMSLRDVHIKSINLLQEKKQGPDRLDKAQNLYNLTCFLYEETLKFMAQTPDERAKKAKEFMENIHTQLHTNKQSAFIDRHSNSFSKFINENFGFFSTTTRTRLNTFEKTCQDLQTDVSMN